MPTIVRKLEAEDWERLHEMHLDGFLHGRCYDFARALHRGLDWPLVGLFFKGECGGDHMDHVGVRNPDWRIFDIRGFVSEDEFGKPYKHPPYHVREIPEDYLHEPRRPKDVCEYAIARARRVAEALWPELPWRGKTFASRMIAYVDEIESVSRKHGFWIRAPLPNPNSAPPLAIGEGDEGGYELRPTINGHTFLVSRYLVPRT